MKPQRDRQNLVAPVARALGIIPVRMVLPLKDGAAAVAIITKLFMAAVLAGVLSAPAFAFEVLPNPNLTGGSVRIDGHDLNATCGRSKEHRSLMNHARSDEILTRYGLPPGTHPDYEIDHLIPLCLGGGDDPSNLWPQPRRSIEPKRRARRRRRGRLARRGDRGGGGRLERAGVRPSGGPRKHPDHDGSELRRGRRRCRRRDRARAGSDPGAAPRRAHSRQAPRGHGDGAARGTGRPTGCDIERRSADARGSAPIEGPRNPFSPRPRTGRGGPCRNGRASGALVRRGGSGVRFDVALSGRDRHRDLTRIAPSRSRPSRAPRSSLASGRRAGAFPPTCSLNAYAVCAGGASRSDGPPELAPWSVEVNYSRCAP